MFIFTTQTYLFWRMWNYFFMNKTVKTPVRFDRINLLCLCSWEQEAYLLSSSFNSACLFLCGFIFFFSYLTESCVSVSCDTPAWWRPSGSGGLVTPSDTRLWSLWTVTESSCRESNLLTYRSPTQPLSSDTSLFLFWLNLFKESISNFIKGLVYPKALKVFSYSSRSTWENTTESRCGPA